jgi:drug/metabolite transporter (DMT)-like permease
VSRAHTRAVGQLALAALFWSLAGLLIKSVGWPPLAVAGGRGLIAGLFLLATSRALRTRPSRAVLIGAAAYAACTVSFCVATKLTTAANAILLQYTAPVWIALLGNWLLKEPARPLDWIVIAVVLCGMALFLADGLESGHFAGNAVAAASGVCFAAMTIALRRQKDGSPIDSIVLGNFLAFALGLPWIVRAQTLPGRGWAALVLLGVVQLGFSYWLYSRAIRHVSALEAVLIPVVEPILNPVWVLLALGERPSGLSLAGGAIVLAAVTVRALASIRAAGVRPEAA